VKRAEAFGNDPQAKRELMVQIWYPAVEGIGKKPDRYLGLAPEVTEALA
jgi:hypothetical protein